MTRLLILLVSLLCCGAAWAHKPSDSYLTLRTAGAQVDGRWDIALRDLDYAIGLDTDGDGKLTWDEIRSHHPDIARYALARLQLASGGTSCPLMAGTQQIDQHTDGAYTVLSFTAACAGPVNALDVAYRLFADTDPQHKGLLRIEHGFSTSTAILGVDKPEQTLQLAEASWLASFADYLQHGVWHIWIGFDHILFLLSLLLPAVLVRKDGRWHSAPAFRSAALDVVRIVSAFTLAHSITLTLAALGVLSLPSRWVESAIAASVIAAALNNLFPVVDRRRWVAAFVFGLIHGFGFASVLADLGLPKGAMAVALLGFNAGVELGQLAIVAVFLPLAYAARASWIYRRMLFTGGSLATVLVATAWLGERALDLQLLPQSEARATGTEGVLPAAIPVVNVVAHYDTAVGTSDAASEGVIRASLIADRPALRTGELLEFVPGMIVTQHSGDGKANQYFLRGFNLDHGTDFATYVDGMPVNMRSHAHGQGYSDLNFLIPELVQRISYSKGPYFASEGDFASAGAAHFRIADRLEQNTANLTAGEDGYRRAVLAGSAAVAQGSLLYGVELHRNDGPWQVPERVRKASATLRYSSGDAGDGFSIMAMAYRNRWTATDQIPLRAVASGALGRFASLDDSDGGSSARYSVSSALHKRLGAARFEVDAYALRSRLDLFSNFTYLLDRPDQGDQFQQSERRDMAGLNASLSWQHSERSRNRIGLQSRFDWLAPVGLYESLRRGRQAVIRKDHVREGSVGLYAENATQWSPHLRTVAGLRFDKYAFDVSGSKKDDRIASPKLSFIWGPWRNTEYFINYGKGFHSNDARSATQAPLAATRGMEAGMRAQPLPGLQSSLALWRLDIASELLFVGDAGNTEATRASKRHGIEWNNHYLVRPWLLLDLDLAASKARYRDRDVAGRHIPGALDKAASAGITLLPRGRWSGSLHWRYFGPRPLVEDNSVRSASSSMASARLGYQLRKGTRLVLDMFNLFNRRASDIDYFYASRLAGEPAGGVEDIHFHPVEPRSMRLTLTQRF
ncbi:TonB-dependent receptor domain-containing protein [Massilia sp. SM-13]|uniref:TonB-dependent receptor domain-containing protein n=1 Tax=Pseudoduganella rhizocola TaxID=3382643 RepID=UPI0038B4A5D5